MALTTASQLASYILFKAGERGISVSNLKLQKLLYYCQAWHLSITGTELFSERIEAWVHGPVVPPVFGAYKANRWMDLPVPTVAIIDEGLPERTISEHVSEILDIYGNLSGTELERLTHREKPWLEARGDAPPYSPSNAIISPDTMREFYQAS